jgi:endonuclease-3 related protein
MELTHEEKIRDYYRALFRAWGSQNWWPARTRFEMIVGAFLTQNTAWTNVERALANLRKARVLSIAGIRELPLSDLENLIRPSGFFRQKAARLKAFIEFLDEKYCGSLTRMFARSTLELRKELLSLNGVGPETADSILLYTGNHPVFVVDAYTLRILVRHEILSEGAPYEEIRQLFQRSLTGFAEHPDENYIRELAEGIAAAPHPPSPVSSAKRTALVQVYNEMHGLIVGVGKKLLQKITAPV